MRTILLKIDISSYFIYNKQYLTRKNPNLIRNEKLTNET